FRFLRDIHVHIKQSWGSTGLAVRASLHHDGEADPDTVGRVTPGSEVRIAEDGEVLIRSAAVFKGYYKEPDATRETMTDDGWLRSGDSGFVDRRGHLVIVDRAKDVGKLADGTPFAPQFVENKLKFSPFIAEAVAFGDRRPFVATIVAIDLTTVGNWAERRNLAYTSFQDLSAKPEVRRLIAGEIADVNASLPAAARIGRFLLLNNGVMIGLMYALIALGFVLIYKATDAINFAQGEFVMFAGFIAAGAADLAGAPFWVSALLSISGMVLLGFGLERVVLRPLIGRPVIAVVMATIGLA